MKLSKLFEHISATCVSGEPDKEITGLCFDNRKVFPGCLFVCIAGARFDTHTCIRQIAEDGAGAVVIERVPEEGIPDTDIPIFLVEDTRKAEAFLSAAYFGYPAEKLTTIGITGSKGKTTTAHMLADILRADGRKVGSVGTNGVEIGDRFEELTNTTPSAWQMQSILREMVDAGLDTAVIECSSQGLKQHRTDGFLFDCGVFLNISKGDHIGPNEHRDFEEYLSCKGLLIRQSRKGFVNNDDPYTEELLRGIDTPVIRFGRKSGADYAAGEIEKTFADQTPGIDFNVHGRCETHLHINLPGDFNVGNALAAVSVASELGAGEEAMKTALSHLSIKGRFDIVFRCEKFAVCVDFAHNGYSTRNHLTALREYRPKRIVCVFGADGNRSKDRRTEMGEACGRLADFSIVTSGHNRWETFEQIFQDIKAGLDSTEGRYLVIPDRTEAIRYAITHAEEGDMITILGLGHESYQEENGVMKPYSDTETVLSIVKELALTGEEEADRKNG